MGHTHEDIDQLIGAIVTYLRTRNLPTVEILITALKLALHDEEGKVKDVVLVIGVTDYDELFAGVRKEGLQGISEAKVLRFSANELGKVCTFYKVCNSQDGWFPKPIEDTHCFFEMQELFRSLHPETDGIVTSIDINGHPGRERGKRQHWLYKVSYASGSEVEVPVKCISLPFVFDQSREMLLQKIEEDAIPQALTGEYSKVFNRQLIFNNIRTLLVHRGDNSMLPSWVSFFDMLNNLDTGSNFVSTLYVVACNHGGETIITKDVSLYSDRLTPNEYVQPMRWRVVQ